MTNPQSDDVARMFLDAARSATQPTLEDIVDHFESNDKGLDATLDAKLRRLDEENFAAGKKQPNPPFSQLPEPVRNEFYNFIGQCAEKIDECALRPDSAIAQMALRQEEADRHSTAGAASISIYKTRTPNPNYGSTIPARWLGALPRNNDFSTGGIEQHRHCRNSTCYPDVASASPVPPQDGMFPASVRRSPHFVYAALDSQEVRSLQQLSAHDAILQFLSHGRINREMALTELIEHVASVTKLAFHCVHLRENRCIDVAFRMEPTSSFVAILRAQALSDQADLCQNVDSDIRIVRADLEKRLRERRDSFARVNRADPEDVAHELRRMQRVRQLFHRDFRTPQTSDTREEHLVRASGTLMAVWNPEESITLKRLRVHFRYMYFSACQCRYSDIELCDMLGVDPPDQSSERRNVFGIPLPKLTEAEAQRTRQMADLFKNSGVASSVATVSTATASTSHDVWRETPLRPN